MNQKTKTTVFLFVLFLLNTCLADNSISAVDQVLDKLHKAAAEADSDTYFFLFSEDAIFIGTDKTETWTMAEFKEYTMPHFSRGKGWTYIPKNRHVYYAKGKSVAWFDEILWNEKYGTSRGTGVLEKEGEQWKVKQYHLTFPIPNALAKDITKRIKSHEVETKPQ